MTRYMHALRRGLVAALLGVTVTVVGACGSESSDDGSNASASGTTATSAATTPRSALSLAGHPSLRGKTVGYIQAGPEAYYQCQADGVEHGVYELGASSSSSTRRQTRRSSSPTART